MVEKNLQNTRYETWGQKPVVRFHHQALTAEGKPAPAHVETVILFDAEIPLDLKLRKIHSTQPNVLPNVIEHLKNERKQNHSQGIDYAIAQLSQIITPNDSETP